MRPNEAGKYDCSMCGLASVANGGQWQDSSASQSDSLAQKIQGHSSMGNGHRLYLHDPKPQVS